MLKRIRDAGFAKAVILIAFTLQLLVVLFAARLPLLYFQRLDNDVILCSSNDNAITFDHQGVVMDDLVWFTPKPKKARMVGWEDEFMRAYKEDNYDPEQRIACDVVDEDKSPYKHHLLCTVPAYVPARMALPHGSQMIPRVLFLSWMTRKLNRDMFTSVLTFLLHNPDYELIFFTDDDTDRYVCQNYPQDVDRFSQLQAGAARTDVWRMMVLQQYGGVYVDFDMSALGHFPIQPEDEGVSGLGCWGHLPTPGGVLEHWALAFLPNHPVIRKTLELIRANMQDLNTSKYVHGKAFIEAEQSFTIRMTGPAVYQRALQSLLKKSGCKPVDGSYCETLRHPSQYCDYSLFKATFGNLKILDKPDLGNSITPQLFDWHDATFRKLQHYDAKIARPLGEPQAGFCDESSILARRDRLQAEWDEKVREKNQKS